MRLCICGLIGWALCAGTLLADEIKATVKSVDARTRSVTVAGADGKEKTFALDKAGIKFQGKSLKDKDAQKMFDTVATTIKHHGYEITLEVEGDKVLTADICLQARQKEGEKIKERHRER